MIVMTRWVRMAVAAGAAGLLVSGCVLRPRYVDLIEGGEEGPALLTLTDAATGSPLAGAQVSWGEGKDKVVLTTDEQGMVLLPHDEKVFAQNPIVVITRPEGVTAVNIDSQPAPTEEPAPRQPSMHIPEGGVGPGQPSDLNRPDEKPTGSPTPPPLPTEEPDSAPDAGSSTAQ